MDLINKLLENDFTKWFAICVFKKYADFNGRARRKEYWMFVAVFMAVYIALALVGFIFGSIASFLSLIFSILILIFVAAIALPSIAAGIRRMHDVGKSGWFLLIPIYSLILLCQDGTLGPNQYGPNPKGL